MAKKNTSKGTELKFSVLDGMSYDPVLGEEITIKGQDFIGWGRDNKYPQYLWHMYTNCATLQSIINGSADYTIGNGLIYGDNIPEHLREENEQGDTLEDVISKCTLDLWVYGGFAVKVRYSQFGTIARVEYVDFKCLRTDEDCNTIYYNKQFGSYGSNRADKYTFFGTGNDVPAEIFYYKGNKTRSTYPVPDYCAALVSAETQIEIQNFHYSTIINNFVANGILNINGAENWDDDTKIRFENGVKNKWTGSHNAANILASFNDNTGNTGITFDRITDDNFDDKYNALSESTRDNIFISLRAIPVLFGLTVQTGFSETEYNEAFKLYNKTAIMPKQKEIIRVFDKILGKGSISFMPFSLTTNTEE